MPAHDRYVETWKAFIELRGEGLVRSIGVSNFQPAHLERVIAETGETPAINQVELHPLPAAGRPAPRARAAGHRDRGLEPAGAGAGARRPGDHRRSPSATRARPPQVVIRWHLQLGNVVIPKSVTPERIAENFDVFDFELSDAEMQALDALDAGRRTGPDPDTFVRP